MADETKVIDVIMGPYRGTRLTVLAADADAAVNSHWATDPNAPLPGPDHEPHPPLSDEERTAALDAANAWAKQTWETAQGTAPPEPPPPEGGVTRDMAADESGTYTTRAARTPRARS